MPADDVGVALAYLAALGGSDPDDVIRLVAESFRNEHHAELGSGCVGRDEYARRLPNFFATFPNRHYEIVEAAVGVLVDVAAPSPAREPADTSDAVTADTDTSATTVDPATSATAATTQVIVNYRFGADVDGVRIDIPGVMWISVRNALVVRRLDCWDSATFQRQTADTSHAAILRPT